MKKSKINLNNNPSHNASETNINYTAALANLLSNKRQNIQSQQQSKNHSNEKHITNQTQTTKSKKTQQIKISFDNVNFGKNSQSPCRNVQSSPQRKIRQNMEQRGGHPKRKQMMLTNSSLSTSVSKERINKTMKNLSNISPSLLIKSPQNLNYSESNQNIKKSSTKSNLNQTQKNLLQTLKQKLSQNNTILIDTQANTKNISTNDINIGSKIDSHKQSKASLPKSSLQTFTNFYFNPDKKNQKNELELSEKLEIYLQNGGKIEEFFKTQQGRLPQILFEQFQQKQEIIDNIQIQTNKQQNCISELQKETQELRSRIKEISIQKIRPQELEMLIQENEQIKKIVQQQHKQICQMQKKEEKVMNLLFVLYKKGIDLEKIYQEFCENGNQITQKIFESDNYKQHTSSSSGQQTRKPINNHNYQTQQTFESDDSPFNKKQWENISQSEASVDMQQIDQVEKFDAKQFEQFQNQLQNRQSKILFALNFILEILIDDPQETKNSPIDFQNQICFKKNPSMKILDNNGMRDKLRINLNNLQNEDAEKGQFLGFHQEFMARLDEFSESWRNAAMKEKKM